MSHILDRKRSVIVPANHGQRIFPCLKALLLSLGQDGLFGEVIGGGDDDRAEAFVVGHPDTHQVVVGTVAPLLGQAGVISGGGLADRSEAFVVGRPDAGPVSVEVVDGLVVAVLLLG